VKYYLPGVFETNPYQGAVNGSLWTLPNEIKLYIGLGLTFYLYKIIKNKLEFLNFSYVILAFTLLFLSKIIQSLTIGEGISNGDKLPFLFLLGSCYCIYKDRLVNTINPIGFLLAIVLLIATYIINHEIMKLSILLCIPTIVLYLAYSPKGKVLAFNKLGDYSYGVYIYAFPVQQTLIHAFPSISLIQHMLLSSIIVLFLATLSWHFIEKPSINWVKRNSKKENAKVS
jgi:peptidoglycan/LPS O-acetylase OafA/YrhL